jgi:hypothetical protein
MQGALAEEALIQGAVAEEGAYLPLSMHEAV